MLISLFFSTLAMAGDCSIPIPQSMFDTKLNDVEDALRNRDSTLMTQKMDQLTDSIPCLAQPVTQIQASRYHTLQGISQFLNKDIDKAQLYFSSARAANSQAHLSTDIYPEKPKVVEIQEVSKKVITKPKVEKPKVDVKKTSNIIEKVISNLDSMKGKTQVKEQVDQITLLRNEFNQFRTVIQNQIANQKVSYAGGGSGEVRLEFLDDVDRDSVKYNNKYLK